MKKSVIALLLAVAMTVGNVGVVPVMAAETTAQEEVEVVSDEGGNSAEEDNHDESVSEIEPEVNDAERQILESEQYSVEEMVENQDSSDNNKTDTNSNEKNLEIEIKDGNKPADSIEAADDVLEKKTNNTDFSTIKAGAPKTIEVISGQYYFYTYATTYGDLSFNVNSDAYCTVVNGGVIGNSGYYYYKLSFYPKDGGKNTIIEVRDNTTGQNIDLLIIHSIYQEAEAQSICIGKSIEVTFEAVNEISQNNTLVTSIGSDTSISCIFNSLTLESIVSHGSNVPNTFYYKANITLYTTGSYTVNLMNSSTYTTLVRVPVTVTEHDYDSGIITSEATCQKKAILTKTCNICGDTVDEEVGEYTEHAWSNIYTVDKASTCTEEGSESIHCSVCNAIDETTVRSITKKEHEYGDWTVTKEASCIEEGNREKVCANCGDKETEAIPATGHIWEEEYTVDKEATCTEEGSESIHCSVCNAIDASEVPDTIIFL